MNNTERESSSTTNAMNEKGGKTAHIEQYESASAEEPTIAPVQHEHMYGEGIDTSDIDDRKLIRKIDLRLIPWLSFLYLLSFLDRTSIGNAKLYGMEKSLGINDSQYNVGLSIFFVSYAVFETPSNVFLKRLKPSFWLSLLMVLWGIAMTCQGLIHNQSGLLVTRWFLGMFEAGLFPGVSFYLSCWYKRSEYGIRAAVFFAAATVSGAFGGLLAAAIGSNMGGVGGKAAWTWIFILEGLATIVAGVASFWIVQDFPDTAKFLNERERAAVIRRLQADDQFSAAGEGLKINALWASLKEPRLYVAMLMYAGADMPLYAFSLFLPSIINQLGYTATKANLLSVPVYVFACIATLLGGWVGDRYRKRGLLNIIQLVTAAVGYIMLVASRNAALSYVGTFLAAAGIYPCIPNTVAWVSNNVEGSYKRGVALGMVISFGNLNGVVSSNVYMGKDKPWYTLGHGLVLMYIVIGLICTLLYQVILRRENAARERGDRDEVIEGYNEKSENADELARRNGRFERVEDAKAQKGDLWSGYRYTL